MSQTTVNDWDVKVDFYIVHPSIVAGGGQNRMISLVDEVTWDLRQPVKRMASVTEYNIGFLFMQPTYTCTLRIMDNSPDINVMRNYHMNKEYFDIFGVENSAPGTYSPKGTWKLYKQLFAGCISTGWRSGIAVETNPISEFTIEARYSSYERPSSGKLNLVGDGWSIVEAVDATGL